MKTPSPFLYDLVSTLTKSEKRYLKVQSGKANQDYIQLLDALLAQKTFDEERLIQENAGANFLKNLAVNKRYLYDLILKSLANFGEKSLEDKINTRIKAAQTLSEKGLFLAALRELNKGQKIAEEYEFFELQIIMCGIEKRLLSSRQNKRPDDSAILGVFKVEEDCLAQLKNTNAYWLLAQQVAQFQMKFQKIQNETQKAYIENLAASSFFRDEALATNFKSKLYFFQLNATYQFMQGNVEKAYEINSRFLDLLEAHPKFLKLYAERYLATLNNMLIDSLVIGKYDMLSTGIGRLDKLLERPEFKVIKHIASRVFRQRYLLLINWSLRQKDFAKALEWIPAIEEGLRHFGKQIEKHHRITFYYLTAYILFQNAQYDQALKWNNLILNESKEDVVKEIFYFARTLNLFIHYALGNDVLLRSLLLSTPKYLKARRTIYATEKTVFRYLGKLLNSIDKRSKRETMTEFKTAIYQHYEEPKEQRVFNYLDLRPWFEKSKP